MQLSLTVTSSYATMVRSKKSNPIASIREHVKEMRSVLNCPACNGVYGQVPVKSGACGHTLCGSCGDKARTTSQCPSCDAPVRPLELTEDRVVRDITSVVTDLNRILADTTSQQSTPQLGRRVCVTGVTDAKSRARLLRALRLLRAQICDAATNFDVCVTTVAAPSREWTANTRAIHYALAFDKPIVDVSWVLACRARTKWLPTTPYEAIRAPRESPVFAHVAVTVACNTNAEMTPTSLQSDVEKWLLATGATLLVDDSATPPHGTRLYVHIVPDLDDESTEQNISERMKQVCDERNIETMIQDVAWVSDCLVTQNCPPSVNLLETMTVGETMNEEELEEM